MTGVSFLATGYCVGTLGLDNKTIRIYMREQETLAAGQAELDLKKRNDAPMDRSIARLGRAS